MSDQFIFFCTNLGNEGLLKEEIKTFFPELNLSYSRKGFLTFKNKGVKYDLYTITQMQVTFATRWGICLGKTDPYELKSTVDKKMQVLGVTSDYIIHSFSINTQFSFDASTYFKAPINQYSADGKLVLNLICLGEKEVWFGLHRVSVGITRYPNASIEINSLPSAASVGFLKLAQVSSLFSLRFDKQDTWLDFGCSPGGSSSYLLSTGANVWGVDTADINEELASHLRFKFCKSSVQDLAQEDLPEGISWVHADLNLNPQQSIKEVLRLCKKYNSTLKGIIFTVQIIKISYVKYIEEFEDIFYDWGFSNIISRQVPAHKNEYALIARRRIKK